MVSPGSEREAVANVREQHGLSELRTGKLVGVSRPVLRYQTKRPDDTPLKQRLCKLVIERRRFGYFRLGYRLARVGITHIHKKLLRIYRAASLLCVSGVAGKGKWTSRRRLSLPEEPDQR